MEELFLKDIGKTIKGLRKERGWTQEHLGSRAGICPKYLGSIERAEVNASLAVMLKIAKALNQEISQLLIAVGGAEKEDKRIYLNRIMDLLKDKGNTTLSVMVKVLDIVFAEDEHTEERNR